MWEVVESPNGFNWWFAFIKKKKKNPYYIKVLQTKRQEDHVFYAYRHNEIIERRRN